VNNASGQRGLVCQYDVVCFDEVSGISFDQKDGVNIMKGYMASGQFSRGKENIRAEGGIVMVGNLDVDVEQQQRISHLLSGIRATRRRDSTGTSTRFQRSRYFTGSEPIGPVRRAEFRTSCPRCRYSPSSAGSL
jgi:predicted ATP-dependent Lon-type protease